MIKKHKTRVYFHPSGHQPIVQTSLWLNSKNVHSEHWPFQPYALEGNGIRMDLKRSPDKIWKYWWLQDCSCRAFTNYEQSGIETMKFQLLQHLMENLQSFDTIEYLQGRLYTATHKCFEKSYCRTSKKCKSEMQKVINQGLYSVYERCKKEKADTAT